MTATTIAMPSDQIASWLRQARQLAAACGCPQAVEPAVRALENRPLDAATLVVTGGPNVGTSAVINQLLDRPLLPVRLYAGSTHEFVIDPAAEPGEERVTSPDGRRLPIDQLESALRGAPEGSAIQITIASPWLLSHKLRVVGRSAFDPADDELDNAAQASLENADCALLVIDALQALRRPEIGFLSFCVRRSIPVAVYLARAAQLADQERADVLAYVSRHVAALSDGIPILQDAPREGLDRLLVNMNVAGLRNLQAAHLLIGAVSAVAAGAEAGLEAQKQTAEDRKKQAARRQAAIEAQDLVWLQIGQTLDDRRQHMANLVRDHLAKNRETTLETLQYELDRSSDIKAWWERDLPFRLQRELRNLAGQSNSVLARQLADDLKWLQESLRKQFNYSLPGGGESGFNVELDLPLRPDMKLTDFAAISLVTRVGSVVAVIGSGILFGPTAGLPMAISVSAGLIGDQIVRSHADKDRERVRVELVRIVQQAEVDYSQVVSDKLRDSYNLIIAGLKEHQARWRAAQFEAAAMAGSRGEAGPRWDDILERAQALITEINRVVHP